MALAKSDSEGGLPPPDVASLPLVFPRYQKNLEAGRALIQAALTSRLQNSSQGSAPTWQVRGSSLARLCLLSGHGDTRGSDRSTAMASIAPE
jgi:hypothetical protein